MFLTEEDYIVASNAALNVLQQCSEEKRETAERMAIEEVSGYLRSRYDVKKIFAATGSERNNIIVLRTSDVALYHLYLRIIYAIKLEKLTEFMILQLLLDIHSRKISFAT